MQTSCELTHSQLLDYLCDDEVSSTQVTSHLMIIDLQRILWCTPWKNYLNHVVLFQTKSEINPTVESVVANSEDYIEPVFDLQVINIYI